MQFRIRSSAWYSHLEVDKLVAHYPCLKDFDLELVGVPHTVCTRLRDESGAFITQTDVYTETHAYVTINTVEQLLELEKAVENPLVVTQDEIEIYDTYRE